MSIQVLVERLAKNGYRATSGPPLAETAEAPTRAEALARLKSKVSARLKKGAELVPLDVSAGSHPWMQFAGMYDADDPVVKEWEKAMAEYRKRIDTHPELP
jgi:hypothetical protein